MDFIRSCLTFEREQPFETVNACARDSKMLLVQSPSSPLTLLNMTPNVP
jgi:hypothetical protein